MCGISGSLNHRGHSPAAIAAQLAQLAHRGPDAAGHFTAGAAAVGQNRLAVIDLETGDPPITDESGRIGAVLNGEIYNHRELRAQLGDRGHRFSTHGDTEVLVHLAQERDAAGIAAALDGMFAFAIWDSEGERLLLGRDRLGKKPLYYTQTSEAFVFGSEIKAVLAHPAVSRDLEEDALSAYLTFGYVPTPRTFFKGVLSLPPGHVLSIRPGGEPRLERYWSVAAAAAVGTPPRTLREAGAGVRSRLERAVSKRLIADVPVGAFLSGGLDSSAIVALMARMSERPVSTFTIGFEDRDGFDERRYARIVADRYGTDHHEFVVAPKAVDLIERLVFHHDQPFGDSSAIPTFLLAEQTRAHVTVALSGDGGDELFAGYERFAAALWVQRYGRLPHSARAALGRLIGALPRTAFARRAASAQRFVTAAELGLPRAYLNWLAFLGPDTHRAALPGGSDWATEDFDERWRASAGAATLDRLLDLNLSTYLVDDLLVKADRMSMANGLEVRSPLLDVELLEYARTLAPALKLRGLDRKRVLKQACADLLPREITHRRKRGFGVPLDRWFREDLAGLVQDRLGDGAARVREHMSGAVVDRLLAEHRGGRTDNGQALWLLLCLELFLRREGW